MTKSKITLDTQFWNGFAKRHWERESLVVKNVNSPLLKMDAREIFKLLVRFANQCRKLKDSEGFKFYVSGEKLHELQVLTLLPMASDRSLEGYHARMSERFEDYCLVCDELLQVNEKKELLTDFTSGLYKHVGFPNRFAEMGLYLGNYRKTPFGVHVDGCGVFSFPILGIKTFRIWPKKYDRKNPKKGSLTIKAGAGDMTYWPSTAWHIAESDGAFSATWSLGVWVNQPLKQDLASVVTTLLAQALGASAAESGSVHFQTLHEKDGQVNTLPAVFIDAIRALQNIPIESFENAFLKNWMTHISKQGLKYVPHKSLSLKNGATVRLRSKSTPILWIHATGDRKMIVSCNGASHEAVYSDDLIKLIKGINKGKSVKVTANFPACLRKLTAAGAWR